MKLSGLCVDNFKAAANIGPGLSDMTALAGARNASKTAALGAFAHLAGSGTSCAGFAGHGRPAGIAVPPVGGNATCCENAPWP